MMNKKCFFYVTKDGIKNRGDIPVPCHDPEDKEDYLVQVLQQGLPKSGNCMKTVTIVGAGMSGLTGSAEFLLTFWTGVSFKVLPVPGILLKCPL